MTTKVTTGTADRALVGRRGELMAELFLDDLRPAFVARASADMGRDAGYDYLVGFPNAAGGINTYAVVVKAAEETRPTVTVSREVYDQLRNSNLPTLLLAIDVKHNTLSYAWPGDDPVGGRRAAATLHVTVADETAKRTLRHRLTEPTRVAEVGG